MRGLNQVFRWSFLDYSLTDCKALHLRGNKKTQQLARSILLAPISVFGNRPVLSLIKRSVELMDRWYVLWKSILPASRSFFGRCHCQHHIVHAETEKISVDGTKCAAQMLGFP